MVRAGAQGARGEVVGARLLQPGEEEGRRDVSAVCSCLGRGYKEGDRLFLEVYDERTKEFSVDMSKINAYQEGSQTLAAQRNTGISIHGGTQPTTEQSNK